MSHPTSSDIKPNIQWVFQKVSRALAFGLGSGLSPMAPGTAGTLWAWAGFLIAEHFFASQTLLWIACVGAFLGCWICGHVSEELGKKDFGGIVLDEIIAFWFILLFIMPASLWMQAIAFILFRFFDAVKPGPIGYIDRYFKGEENTGESSTTLQILWRGFGIMVDDLAAALSTLLIIALLQMIGSHLGWM